MIHQSPHVLPLKESESRSNDAPQILAQYAQTESRLNLASKLANALKKGFLPYRDQP